MDKNNLDDLTTDQALEVMRIIRKEELYDGVIPSLDDEDKLLELAKEYITFAISADKDGNALPVTYDLLAAAGIKPPREVKEEILTQLTQDAQDMSGYDDMPETDISGMIERTNSPPLANEEQIKEFTEKVKEANKPVEKSYAGTTWLNTLNTAAKKMNLPVPDDLDKDNIPKFPRDISAEPTKTIHKLYGQFNSALASASYQAILASVDAKSYKLLAQKKHNELTKQYIDAGESRTSAKELSSMHSDYEEINDKYEEMLTKKEYYDKLASVYGRNCDVLSRSLVFREQEGK